MALGACLGVIGLAVLSQAPTTIRGVVVARELRTPIGGASVALRHGGAVLTDRLGRFQLELVRLPDTLTVSAIGWRPDTIAIGDPPEDPLTIEVLRAPVVVSDLITSAVRSLDRPTVPQWTMPMAVARSIPPAIETDVYRSLALVPAVSFTSPLSSRPLVRGYDAGQVSTRIDGFDVVNLYHLGRVFAAFPADAADQVVVTVPPGGVEVGGSVAGLIDVTGRTGSADAVHGNLGMSFGSVSGSVGGQSHGLRLFGAGRVFHAKLLELVPGIHLPYEFEDLYLSGALGDPDRPAGRVTVFATRDRLGQSGDRHLDWDNVLLGARWPLLARGGVTLDLATSAAEFRESGRNVPSAARGPADFANRFARWTSTAELAVSGRSTRFGAGAEAGWHSVRNRIAPSRATTEPLDFPTAATSHVDGVLAAWTTAAQRVGRIALEVGLRADRSGRQGTLAPRVLVEWTAGRATLRAGLGRATRLDHVVGDARPEPELDFLDLWFPAGDTIPTARVDHGTLDLVIDWRPLVVRASLFASRGAGIGELRPESDQRTAPRSFVRFGRARTSGLELQVALRDDRSNGRSLSASYTYSRSERAWDGARDWVRWSLDRRHQARAFGQTRRGRVAVFAAIDLASGPPLTPIAYRVAREPPGLPDALGTARLPAVVYGAESSYETSGTVRVDGGLSYQLKDRGRTRVSAGLSIINLFGGPVAPIGTLGNGPAAVDPIGRPTEYRRRFSLPGIPTLTLRVEF